MTCYKEYVTDGVVPCPTCDFPVPPDQIGCPNCRAERHRRRRPFYIAILVLLGAAGAAYPKLSAVWKQFAAEVDSVQHPGRDMKYVGDGSTGTAPAVVAPSPAPAPSGLYLGAGAPPAGSHSPPPQAPPPPPQPSPIVVVAPAAGPVDAVPPEPPTNEPQAPMRRVYGVVYDIKTLKAVPAARVVISARGGLPPAYATTTDQRGHYRVDVMDGPGANLVVTATAPGYRPGSIEDQDPPYRQRSERSRREFVEQTTDSDLEPFNFRCPPSHTLVALDLVLVPQEPEK